MFYVHNQWYDISCATLYLENFVFLMETAKRSIYDNDKPKNLRT